MKGSQQANGYPLDSVGLNGSWKVTMVGRDQWALLKLDTAQNYLLFIRFVPFVCVCVVLSRMGRLLLWLL